MCVCVQNRGSAIAKIVGANVTKFNDKFEEKVTMYVFEEMVNGKKLTEIINEQHENVKYLPGHKLPPNIVSVLQNLYNKSSTQRKEKKNSFFYIRIILQKEKNIIYLTYIKVLTLKLW